MPLFSRRLPHVLTRAELARLLTPTYAGAANVDDEEAYDRLVRALADQRVQDDVHEGISQALREAQGARTTEDQVVDKLIQGLKRRRVKAANVSPAVSAALVHLDLAIGLAPEQMRDMLTTDKGRALLEAGLRELGVHLVRELLK